MAPSSPSVTGSGKWIKLHDPARTPPHWLDSIQPGEYAVFILNARSRLATNDAGQPFRTGEASTRICPDLPSAIVFAESVVDAHPELCCQIYDSTGKSGDPIETVYNPSEQGKYVGLPVAKRELLIGCCLIAAAIPFIVYDARHELAWLWGYVVGLKLTVVGSTFAIRGTAGIIEHHRARAK